MPRRDAPRGSAMVGRDDEVDLLRLQVRRRPALLQVDGEAGVGKSRLVRELAERVARDGDVVLVGHCQQVREPFVLGAVLDALRQARARLARGVALNPVTSALRPLVPELADLLPETPVGVGDPVLDRHLLFRAIREVLAALGPTALVVEDLHWADDGTLHLIRFLMADPPPGLAVVVTYRREEIAHGMPWGAAYRPGEGVTSDIVQLAPLGVAHVRELSAQFLGVDAVSAEFAERLLELTAGLPFAVEEVLRSLGGRDAGTADDAVALLLRMSQRGEVPVLVREAVAERLAALSPDAVRLAHAAATVAVPAGVEVLGAVAGLSDDRLRAAVDEAVACSILHVAAGATVAFRHVLARQAVYSAISPVDRRSAHDSAVRVLAALRPRPLVQLAEHSRLADRRADWLAYGEAAADQALAVLDGATAVPLLQHLIAEPGLSGAQVDRLGVKLGEALLLGWDVRGAVSTLKRLLLAARLSTEARGEVRMRLGLLLMARTDGVSEARAQLEAAVGELGARPELAARCMAVLAQPRCGDTPLPSLTPWLLKAEAEIDPCADTALRIGLLSEVATALTASGDPAAQDRIARMPATATTAEEQRQIARGHCDLADAMASVGRFRPAAEHLRLGMGAARECGASYVCAVGRGTGLRLDWFTGAWDGLEERARALLVEFPDLNSVAADARVVLGSLALSRGEYALAQEHLAQTGVRAPGNAIASVALASAAGLVRCALRADDVMLAVVEADAGMALLRRKEVWAWAGELAPAAVDAYLAAGRVADAEDVARSLADGLRGLVAPLAAVALRTCWGALAAHAGGSGAEHHVAAALAYEEMGAPYLAAMARERAVEPRAVEAYRRCMERYQALGATHDAARCRHALRTVGVRTPSRQGRRGYGDTLSPRELDVARLLAAGHTNSEIARVLFLSPRTVEQHASRVLRKLNVSSRRGVRAADLG